MGTPAMTGKNFIGKLFVDSDQVGALDIKSFKCKPNITAIADGVLGEDRDRIDRETNYYEITLSCFNVNTAKIQKLIADQANDDIGVQPLVKSFGLILKPKDGSKDAYVTKGDHAIVDWELGFGERKDRGMIDITIHCQYFDRVVL